MFEFIIMPCGCDPGLEKLLHIIYESTLLLFNCLTQKYHDHIVLQDTFVVGQKDNTSDQSVQYTNVPQK